MAFASHVFSALGLASRSGSPCLVKHCEASSLIRALVIVFASIMSANTLQSIILAVSTVFIHSMGLTSEGCTVEKLYAVVNLKYSSKRSDFLRFYLYLCHAIYAIGGWLQQPPPYRAYLVVSEDRL